MIVYPAYIYIAQKIGPLPDFNLWDGSVVNVPYTLKNAEWDKSSATFVLKAKGYVEFTVNAVGYSKFKINAKTANYSGSSINIEYYNSNGDLISTVTQSIKRTAAFYTIDIPEGARVSSAKIRINNTETTPMSSITIYGATLQE